MAIIGGGYSGLWTAYYLKTLAPDCAICVLEAEHCGFGASGRNGGWMMSALQGEQRFHRDSPGIDSAAVRQHILGILPEVERVLARERLDCDYQRGGGLFAAARYPEQLGWQREHLAELQALGYGEEDYRWLDSAELTARLRLARPLGAIYTPHIARIQPAKLASGLATAVSRPGVRIFEHTPVVAARGTELSTPGGRPRSCFDGDAEAFQDVRQLLLACLPQLQAVAVTHAWGGTLGIPRSGSAHAVLDPATGFACLGGYTGEGVGAANLLARSLADLILERNSDLARMPWCQRLPVARALRRWEPEPLRWLGIRATSAILGWQETACAGGAPQWRRRLLGLAASALNGLRDRD